MTASPPGARHGRRIAQVREQRLEQLACIAGPRAFVLAGSPPLLDQFCALSRNLHRLAGFVASRDQDTALDLGACTEAIESYLRTRRSKLPVEENFYQPGPSPRRAPGGRSGEVSSAA